MKIAIIHDWLDKYGGAERVVTSFDKIISFDYYFAYADVMNDSDKLKMFNGKNPTIIKSDLMKILGTYFRFAFPLFPFITKCFNSQVHNKYSVDLLISSSWCLSKGFRINSEFHICYIQARNFKYIWDEYKNYFPGILGYIFIPFRKYLQNFDIKMSKNPDHIIANSKFVQKWIKEHYKLDSTVIYPPVSVEDFSLRKTKISDSKYYVTVGRLVKYKRFDLLIDAFIKLNKKLIVIGDGAERTNLEKKAKNNDNIIFTGFLSSNEISSYISNARAFVFSSIEDFGIAPVEAQSCGTPVIAYAKGGVLETVVENKTGVFFKSQDVNAIQDAVKHFENILSNFDSVLIRENAQNFSEEAFAENLRVFLKKNVYK
ncbi:glycosyltransferase [Chryseobacterium indoltheticum]|uniref:GDP-mannose-dependent alpha-(1-6)-phosphatidylinositol monomannoside mannosyltransferase n=1 Tax=Chryseobacterium indoltheticum TaxID=254 RepID=A0A381F565_9FLAO|nr:glycosyltransferase [Chryseobacterium indoltheticum]AZA75212.1 glycosyltransferase family 4 protein [Chryseobacterium indoltheticum]SIR14700.1 Glycosyltransferase involved in cell wall bisynthesis [Chryseobacterium indoltheticum]SUX41701.1 GDP-mannose-dependent alpha-(1-6)-phosphatidylinositol monomannoside mannosyltransferase [Chryseobacterium indoltheticum]